MPRNGTAALAHRPTSADALHQLEKVVIQGDLASLTPEERIAYYARVTESLGLNPLTRPFEFITLNGKLTLYARRDATDQLRAIKGISVDRIERERDDALGLAVVTVYGHDRSGRTDSAIGVISIKGLTGEGLANALMKAETKAKRRMTLSLAGLGWLDETEIDDVTDPAPAPTVETRREAVAQRLAALPDPEAPRADAWMRRLHAVGTERGLDHVALHDLAVATFGVESLNDLTTAQRTDLMTEVESRPLATEQPAPAPDDAGGTPAPVDVDAAIQAVWDAAVAHGIASTEGDEDWGPIFGIARSLFPDTDLNELGADWLTVAAEISTGKHDPAPKRPRAKSRS